MKNREIILVRYGAGDPTVDMFALRETVRPVPAAGEALVATLWLSMDPFPRMQMTGLPGGPPPLPLGEPVIGRGVARVLESCREDLKPGDVIVCDPGWRDYAIVTGAVRKLDLAHGAPQASLGLMGPSGLTAYFCLQDVLGLSAGETVAVSAAAGSVGLAACQIAKALGARVIALTSGPEQTAFLVSHRLADAVIDRLAEPDLTLALKAAAPTGLNAALDTVGGAMFEAILAAAAPRARIVMAGFISVYGGDRPRYVDPYALIFKRIQVTGFLLADHAAGFDAAYARMADWFATGALVSHEAVTVGLERAPEAFAALFKSPAPGKHLVKVADL